MLLLKALTDTQIQNIYKSYKFKIYGKGHLENKLKKFIKKKKLEKKLEFTHQKII